MRDWTGTRIQADALTVACRDCLQPIGEECRNKYTGEVLTAFPAHAKRINDAKRASGP